ncbi:MAG: hypothetical protein H6633_05365 [Anaerolineales bacterium]|nr:hypothetical protein [Anaerolineales bacterium]
MGKINLKREEYRNPHTQINDLQIGSANPNLLYATAADSNSFLKIDLTTLTQVDKLFVNNQSFGPHYFIAHPSRSSGYVLIHQSKNAFELDLQENVINRIVEFPLIRDDIFAYDGVFNDAGELLIAQGESILEIDTEGMRLLKTHLLPQNLAPVWQFVLSNDWSRMYSISQERNQNEYHPDIFQAINTVDYGMGASFQLDGGSFKERPFVLPDGKNCML